MKLFGIFTWKRSLVLHGVRSERVGMKVVTDERSF